ncbi:response regulator transcription factor [Streptomyces nymphaeiformis]|uniref:DNA-binding NarL/FixJ family response regulator n=1 Tax=Streptomyces nymphaeiformis TaxID=2663842 RepID=A0A7W7U6S2_9ACTN|nr:response regulator transcription factor [Streptomyces nymphaeiformis]MBB4985257.1 DNA-binding NarL/FixJ family response regulator [Streptomyces nymphaeiformis]
MSAADGDRVARVLVADDQAVVREGIVMLLGLLPGIEVVGSARDGEEAVALTAELGPDVVLMDLRMPRCDGVEATRRIRDRHPGTEVVVLTTYADDDSLFPALQAGARGYLTKDAGGEEIERAVRDVIDGRAGLSPAVQRRLLERLIDRDGRAGRAERDGGDGGDGWGDRDDRDGWGDPNTRGEPSVAGGGLGARSGASGGSSGPGVDGLTERETEVLVLVADGLSNPEIAGRLRISTATVKTHINNLFAKTGVRDRVQAVRYAYQHGLVRAPGRRVT